MRRYPGLSPFSAEQKDLFFGRDTDIKELSKLIFVERKVLLYSKSGYGKTSLLNAGVIPELQKNNDFEFIKVRFRAYSEGNDTPNENFLQILNQHRDFSETSQSILDDFNTKYGTNYWLMLKRNQLIGNNHKTYVFIFDQFEELFTYPQKQVTEFKQKLAEIILTNQHPTFFHEIEDKLFEKNINENEIEKLYQPLNVKAVFSIRSDRLSELNNLADEIPDIQKIFYVLQPLTTTQAKEAIENPAKKTNIPSCPEFDIFPFTYEPAAIDKIIKALTIKGKDNIETTQLQIVCQRIEEDIISRNLEGFKKPQGLKITTKDIPDFKDIFLHFYNDALAKVTNEATATVAKFIEDQLIIDGRRISLDEIICRKYVNEATLKTLVETRLLRAKHNSVEGFSYELSHDTLVPPIKEIADKRRAREENERLKAKQRGQIRIIALSVLVAIVSIGAAIIGFCQYNIAQKTLRELKGLNFEKFCKEAEAQKEKSNYIEAYKSYENAKPFAVDTQSVNNKMDSCKLLMAQKELFLGLLKKGEVSLKEKNWYRRIGRPC